MLNQNLIISERFTRPKGPASAARNPAGIQFQGMKKRDPVPDSLRHLLDAESDEVVFQSPISPARRKELTDTILRHRQSSYLPVFNNPPERPKGYKNTTMVELPEGFTPPGIRQKPPASPLENPTARSLENLKPGELLTFEIPPVEGRTLNIKTNPQARMDLANDQQASRLVAGGNQPSIISRNWKALWGLEKVTRDILQNFFDGHGGTLEGTSIHITREPDNGQYRVRINGLSQYDYEKAYLLGGTSKGDDEAAAGNFGEGLKVIALNLLRDYGADYVEMASANWKMNYTLPEAKGGVPKLFRHLTETSGLESGNYLEFTTDRPDLLEQLFASVNYFYNPYNPDFTGTTYETRYGGLQISDIPYAKGNVYLARQRFAYERDDNWEGPLEGVSIWTNKKILNKGRDRRAVHKTELQTIIRDIVGTMSNEDLIYTLKKMEPHWGQDSDKHAAAYVVSQVMAEIGKRKLSTDFDEKYYAGDRKRVPADIVSLLEKTGHVIAPHDFQYIGMTPLQDWHLYFTNFKAIEPSEDEKFRLGILRETMTAFLTELQARGGDTLIHDEDLLKPIYLYDREAKKSPDSLTEGMARYNAIWFGRDVLSVPLPVALNYYMHELMHKHGPDDGKAFSEVYDQYLPVLMKVMTESSGFIGRMQELDVLWRESIEKDGSQYHGGLYERKPEPPVEIPVQGFDGSTGSWLVGKGDKGERYTPEKIIGHRDYPWNPENIVPTDKTDFSHKRQSDEPIGKSGKKTDLLKFPKKKGGEQP